MPFSGGFDTKTALRAKSKFQRAINRITPVQSPGEKYSSFAFAEFRFSCRRPALTRGALRGRHGRGGRDAMDVTGPVLLRKTTGCGADGEIVWSWPPDAEVKPALMLTHRAGDGGQKARRTEESAYKPVKTVAQGRPVARPILW
ncbi:hypothetical protein ACQR0Z_16965 [Bradyrhizobium sp. HKCCYLS3077]|uniref:hypothetical protein n=1 Tax=Bradyrhizobium sp. HKCCYLS3077 TaxID=3420761 RepID=UPI003EBCED56